jgi:hypothetical protein
METCIRRGAFAFDILSLGRLLAVIFACWEFAAQALYVSLFGPAPPQSFTQFVGDINHTQRGWNLIGFGTVALWGWIVVASLAVGFLLVIAGLAVVVRPSKPRRRPQSRRAEQGVVRIGGRWDCNSACHVDPQSARGSNDQVFDFLRALF